MIAVWYKRNWVYGIIVLSSLYCVVASATFKLGVENIPEVLAKKLCPLKKKDLCMLGLITNQSGVDQRGKRTIDILVDEGYSLRYIFAPEHGMNGTLAEA